MAAKSTLEATIWLLGGRGAVAPAALQALAGETGPERTIRAVKVGSADRLLASATDRLSFAANRLKGDLLAADVEPGAVRATAAESLVHAVEEAVAEIDRGTFAVANSDRLAELMGATQGDVAKLAAVVAEIEKRIEGEIGGMAEKILESYNAVRPPSFRSDRLSFDGEAILRMARASRLQRVSQVVVQSVEDVPGVHRELDAALSGKEDSSFEHLNQFSLTIKEGPERIRGEGPIPDSILSPEKSLDQLEKRLQEMQKNAPAEKW